MSATTLPRPALALVPPPLADDVPTRIRIRAVAGGWKTCDVCRWPVDPVTAFVAANGRQRHITCVCCVCDAPLLEIVPGQSWHEPCVRPAGTARRQRRVRHGR